MSQPKKDGNLKKSIIILFFILLPTVSASSFTGTFTDYGKDTGSDGLYNYLTIEAEVSVTGAPKNYSILGILQDSIGNLIEYENCSLKTTNGIQNFTLDFDGIKIYRNKVNGPYNLTYVEITNVACSGQGLPPEPEHSLINAHTTKAYNYTQFQTGKAAIYCNSSPCIASSQLIRSRDNISGMPEPNSPNTIDGCEDGIYGSYPSRSIENLTITSLNHSYFKIGDTVKVDVAVICSSFPGFDHMNFVYANTINSVQWSVKDYFSCPFQGVNTLSTTFKLDNNIGQHAVRGVFGFTVNTNTVCGQDEVDDTPYWVDQDDVVIYVKECNSAVDCPITECDQLDQCYSGTYRNYHDMPNSCLASFSCEHKTCTDYNEVITDIDGDTYDTECDNDCNDSNHNINPGADENCSNGIDDDCDTYTDTDDPECQGKYPIYLTEGWNLISLPKIDNSSITEISKLFNFEKIIALKDGEWYIYDKTPNSNLNQLSEENGFWIQSNINQTILIDDQSASFTQFNLIKGWNLIGYPSIEETNINKILENVIDDIELIYLYNNEFQSFNPQKPENITIKPGMGIFVKVKSATSWYFDTSYKKGFLYYSLPLSEGWNLVSIPLESNQTVSEIFSSKTLYYLENNKWKSIEASDKIDYSHGYWIKTNTSLLTIEGKPINNLYYTINQDWNLLNYPLTESTSITTFFQNTMDNIEAAATYENKTWKTFNPQKPSNTLTTLNPGIGIFIKAKNNANWHFNGNELVTT